MILGKGFLGREYNLYLGWERALHIRGPDGMPDCLTRMLKKGLRRQKRGEQGLDHGGRCWPWLEFGYLL